MMTNAAKYMTETMPMMLQLNRFAKEFLPIFDVLINDKNTKS